MIGVGVHIYIKPKKNLNGILALDSSNVLSVDFLSNYKLALPLHTQEMLSSLNKSRISLFNAHLALFCLKDDTITVAHTHW